MVTIRTAHTAGDDGFAESILRIDHRHGTEIGHHAIVVAVGAV